LLCRNPPSNGQKIDWRKKRTVKRNLRFGAVCIPERSRRQRSLRPLLKAG
jgi:hypothetical protein